MDHEKLLKKLAEKVAEKLNLVDESKPVDLESAITELAEEIRREKHGPKARFVLALCRDVLVPIIAATVGAVGIYYVEIAKLTAEKVQKATAIELEKADVAKEFVERAVKPKIEEYEAKKAAVEEAKAADPDLPVEDPEPPKLASREELDRLSDLWKAERGKALPTGGGDDGGPTVVNDEPSAAQIMLQAPPKHYIERALKQAQAQIKK